MRVWKLEACQSEERIICRWGYALAETSNEALDIAKATSGTAFNWAHEKHPAMLWPGKPGRIVSWSN